MIRIIKDFTVASRDNTVASHLAGPDWVPGRVSFPCCGFSGFFLNYITYVPSIPDIIGHHNHQNSFITDANDI